MNDVEDNNSTLYKAIQTLRSATQQFKEAKRMNTFDTYIVQDEYAQRHTNLTNEVRDAQMMQAKIGRQLTQAQNWLGTRFIAWGTQLQGSQDAKLEWTHW